MQTNSHIKKIASKRKRPRRGKLKRQQKNQRKEAEKEHQD